MFYAALIYILAVISPGPNFILVSRYSALGSLKIGLAVTLGICSVGILFSTLSLLGLSSILSLFPNFSRISVALGAVYLLYIAYTIFIGLIMSQKVTYDAFEHSQPLSYSIKKSYLIGAITNILNMKTIAFMISIYSGFLAIHRTQLEQITLVVICSSLEFIWYFFVVLIFSKSSVRIIFIRYRKFIDLSFYIFLILFALQNIYSII